MWSGEAELEGAGDGGGAGVDVEFGEDVHQVGAGGAGADEEGAGDLGVGVAFGEEAEDVQLAGGEANRVEGGGAILGWGCGGSGGGEGDGFGDGGIERERCAGGAGGVERRLAEGFAGDRFGVVEIGAEEGPGWGCGQVAQRFGDAEEAGGGCRDDRCRRRGG